MSLDAPAQCARASFVKNDFILSHGLMAAGSVVVLVIARSYRRRDGRNVLTPLCRSCGYNLIGNVSGRCPECGAAVWGAITRPTSDTTWQ